MVLLMRPLLLASLLLLASCASSGGAAPIVDRQNPSERAPKHYVVSRGDTLFSIAWRYGFDVQRLAAANDIGPPYTIYPGQSLALREANIATKPRPPVQPPAAPAKQAQPPPVSKAPPPRPQPPSDKVADGAWRWPVNGPVVRAFVASGQAHKGIDIGGKIGEPVHAAKSGVVVYSGSGLVGYGNLLILKHTPRHLSAYGHNRQLLVKEGDKVNAGDVIAQLGDSGTDSAKLHFEVRVDGKPVDPLRLLPKRN